jgi:hypothetical protein
MILGDVFERFAQDSPLSVMARGVMENALSPTLVDRLFEDVADKQYTKRLLFSSRLIRCFREMSATGRV